MRGNKNSLLLVCASRDFNARNPKMLEVHMKAEHKTVTEFKCKVCSQLFINQDTMEVHLVEKHTGDIDCVRYEAVFKKQQDVYDHCND